MAGVLSAQTTVTLREGIGGYTHVGALIRADAPTQNSGVRDQLIVGKTTAAIRATFSFGLSVIPPDAVITGVELDLWTDAQSSTAVGTVGALELHALNGTPSEGIGNGSTVSDGAGSGVTWNSRDGQATTGHLWTTAGGDFSSTVLSSVPGYNATTPNVRKNFISTADFVAAVQVALGQGQPLNLLLNSPTTEAGAGSAYSRIASDDSLTLEQRPRLTITYTPGGIVGNPTGPAAINLVASAVSWSQIALCWLDQTSKETSFVIERQTGPAGEWTPVIVTGADVTTIMDTAAAQATTYTYRIKGVYADGGESPYITGGAVTTPAATARLPIVILPLGDSLTMGQGSTLTGQPDSGLVPGGYRGPLLTLLSAADYQITYAGSTTTNASANLTVANNAAHEGHGGYTITQLQGNLDASGHWIDGIPDTRAAIFPDVILLLAGANDLGIHQMSAATTLANYDAFLNKLATLRPGAWIIASTLIPYTGSTYPSREEHQVEFNSGLPALIAAHQAAGHRVMLYDMRTKVNASHISTDGVHPTQAGYDAMAVGWAEAFQALPLIESWHVGFFGSAAPAGSAANLADPDGDGHCNLFEYAIGGDPTHGDASTEPHADIVTDTGQRYLTLSFPRRKQADISYLVEVADGLAASTVWTAGTVQWGAPVGLDASMAGFERVTYRDRTPVGTAAQRFMRLKITAP